LSKGGGKKRAIIDYSPYLQGLTSAVDLRLYDGDVLFIPFLKKASKSVVPLSILAGITPQFIEVIMNGKIENPGRVKVPLEGSLSDVMNLAGPKKPLGGKILLIRYNKDGSITRKSINYSSRAPIGSKSNPNLLDGDLLTVQNSLLGRSSGTLKSLTEPFVGIYAAKELFNNLSGN